MKIELSENRPTPYLNRAAYFLLSRSVTKIDMQVTIIETTVKIEFMTIGSPPFRVQPHDPALCTLFIIPQVMTKVNNFFAV